MGDDTSASELFGGGGGGGKQFGRSEAHSTIGGGDTIFFGGSGLKPDQIVLIVGAGLLALVLVFSLFLNRR